MPLLHVEQVLRSTLISNADVTEIVGTRVFAHSIPAGEVLPAITYQVLNETVGMTFNGPERVRKSRIRYDTWAESYATMKELSDAVEACLHGHRGVVDRITIQGCFLENRTESFVPDTNLFHEAVDFTIWHEEG